MAFKLFIGGLPQDVTTDQLNDVFNTYGSVTDSHVMKGKSVSGQSCAFVVMDSKMSADTAISSLDGIYSIREGDQPLSVAWAKQGGGGGAPAPSYGGKGGSPGYTGGAPIGASYGGCALGAPAYGAGGKGYVAPVAYAPAGGGYAPAGGGYAPAGGGYAPAGGGYAPAGGGYLASAGVVAPPPPVHAQAQMPTKLFVGNLPVDISQEAMQLVFGTYGTVTNIHIMQGKAKSGQSCGFIEYSNSVEAETAILTLNDKYELRPGEGVIMVKYANSQGGPQRFGPY